MRKVFFIDIDGVLVTPWSMSQKRIALSELSDYEPYAEEAVTALNMIIEEIDPLFVIHSSRRYQYRLNEFKVIWKDSGIRYNNLDVLEGYADNDGMLCDGPNEEKVYDIQRYVDIHKLSVNDFLVLEDENLPMPNVYLLNGNIGLTTKNAERIIGQL